MFVVPGSVPAKAVQGGSEHLSTHSLHSLCRSRVCWPSVVIGGSVSSAYCTCHVKQHCPTPNTTLFQHNTSSTLQTQHILNTTQHMLNTTLPQHNTASTQHITFSTQHWLNTTQHCLNTTLLNNTTQHRLNRTQHRLNTTLSQPNTRLSQHNTDPGKCQKLNSKVLVKEPITK